MKVKRFASKSMYVKSGVLDIDLMYEVCDLIKALNLGKNPRVSHIAQGENSTTYVISQGGYTFAIDSFHRTACTSYRVVSENKGTVQRVFRKLERQLQNLAPFTSAQEANDWLAAENEKMTKTD